MKRKQQQQQNNKKNNNNKHNNQQPLKKQKIDKPQMTRQSSPQQQVNEENNNESTPSMFKDAWRQKDSTIQEAKHFVEKFLFSDATIVRNNNEIDDDDGNQEKHSDDDDDENEESINLQKFITEYYETRTHLHMRTLPSIIMEKEQKSTHVFKQMLSLYSVMDVARILASHDLYLRNDVRLVRLDDEESALSDYTPEPEKVSMKLVQQYVKDGWSVHFKNMDEFSVAISDCLQMMDKYWRGQGGCFATVTYTPSGMVAFPTFSEPNDRFVFQIEGSQTILLYKPMENESESESYPYFHYGGQYPITVYDVNDVDNNGILAEQIEMQSGDICFIPEGYIAYCESEVNSLALSIGLSKQTSVQDVVQSMVSEASLKLKISNRVLPHDDTNGFGSVLRKQATSVLQEALQFENKVMNQLMSRSMYTRASFNMNNFVKQYNLMDLLSKNNGLVKISNFLPAEIADRLYNVVDSISEDEWILTQANENIKRNNIDHAFHSTKSFPYNDAIFNIFRRLMPDCESTFSAGRYTNAHFIDPHDDRQYKDIDGQEYSRYVAVIYYLTPDWKKEDGGALVDIDGDRTYVPEYNSVVSFTIPRWHEVLPCMTNKPRYSIFGWFLKSGQLYELNTDESSSY